MYTILIKRFVIVFSTSFTTVLGKRLLPILQTLIDNNYVRVYCSNYPYIVPFLFGHSTPMCIIGSCPIVPLLGDSMVEYHGIPTLTPGKGTNIPG